MQGVIVFVCIFAICLGFAAVMGGIVTIAAGDTSTLAYVAACGLIAFLAGFALKHLDEF